MSSPGFSDIKKTIAENDDGFFDPKDWLLLNNPGLKCFIITSQHNNVIPGSKTRNIEGVITHALNILECSLFNNLSDHIRKLNGPAFPFSRFIESNFQKFLNRIRIHLHLTIDRNIRNTNRSDVHSLTQCIRTTICSRNCETGSVIAKGSICMRWKIGRAHV